MEEKNDMRTTNRTSARTLRGETSQTQQVMAQNTMPISPRQHSLSNRRHHTQRLRMLRLWNQRRHLRNHHETRRSEVR